MPALAFLYSFLHHTFFLLVSERLQGRLFGVALYRFITFALSPRWGFLSCVPSLACPRRLLSPSVAHPRSRGKSTRLPPAHGPPCRLVCFLEKCSFSLATSVRLPTSRSSVLLRFLLLWILSWPGSLCLRSRSFIESCLFCTGAPHSIFI